MRLEHYPPCSASATNDPQEAWYRLFGEAMGSYCLERDPPIPLVAQVSKVTFCCEYIKERALEKAGIVESDVWKQLKLPLDY